MSILPLFLQNPKIVGLDWPHWDGADRPHPQRANLKNGNRLERTSTIHQTPQPKMKNTNEKKDPSFCVRELVSVDGLKRT